jgi:hypothetical protein
MTPEEAKARYEQEWPALNEGKQNAVNPLEAKKWRRALNQLSQQCAARHELNRLPEPEPALPLFDMVMTKHNYSIDTMTPTELLGAISDALEELKS